jgi:hypothetical protein
MWSTKRSGHARNPRQDFSEFSERRLGRSLPLDSAKAKSQQVELSQWMTRLAKVRTLAMQSQKAGWGGKQERT